MNVIAIDTHEVAKELKAVGFSEDQAEAVTRIVRRPQDIDLSPLATKDDTKTEFDTLRRETKAEFDSVRKDIDGLRKELKADLAEQNADLLKWIIGTTGFQTVAILGAVFALTHALTP